MATMMITKKTENFKGDRSWRAVVVEEMKLTSMDLEDLKSSPNMINNQRKENVQAQEISSY